MLKKVAAALLAATAFVPGSAAFAQTVSAARSTPVLATEAGGVRYRELSCRSGSGSCNDAEVYLGSQLGTVNGPYSQQQNFYENDGTTDFTFSYNAGTDTLTSILRGQQLDRVGFLAGLSTAVTSLSFDTIQVLLRDGQAGNGTLGLSNLVLNGSSLGSLAGVDNGSTYFALRGFNFKQNFTLAGTLNLGGSNFSPSAELNRVEFLVGKGIAAVPEPETWAMLIGGFAMVGAAMRRRRASPHAAIA
jgi:hypothetical protein